MKRTNRSGFTLVEIMIVVAIIALLAAIAIPNLLRARISANDALARSTLRTLSTAAETFATANNGNYPTWEGALVTANPPYTNRWYCGQSIAGFFYACSWSGAAYTFWAQPLIMGRTGSVTYVMQTGGVLTP